jgi:hypothetical protein
MIPSVPLIKLELQSLLTTQLGEGFIIYYDSCAIVSQVLMKSKVFLLINLFIYIQVTKLILISHLYFSILYDFLPFSKLHYPSANQGPSLYYPIGLPPSMAICYPHEHYLYNTHYFSCMVILPGVLDRADKGTMIL